MGTMIRDPRVRQTLNQISDNFESVADTAKFGCFSFTKSYLEPCFNSVATFCPSPQAVCPCFYHDPSTSRRRRRGRPEFAFEFYNSDYDDEAPDDPLRWGNDELDRLLAGSGATSRKKKAGARNEGMYYTRSGQRRTRPEGRRKSGLLPHDGEPDPTIIPNTSALGFLNYFTWVRKRQALRYKPSAADLQDHPGGYGGVGGEFREEDIDEEAEALLGVGRSTDDAMSHRSKQRGRNRSGTTSSGDTTDTFRSRADLFPSEDEDDAVPLDDEFEIDLGPETTPTGKRSRKAPRRRQTGDTFSGLSGRDSFGSPARSGGRKTPLSDEFKIEDDIDFEEDAEAVGMDSPNLALGRSDDDLRREEEELRKEEEEAIQLRREAAARLALRRGLSSSGPSSPLLEATDRNVPMFDAGSPVAMPESDVDEPTPLNLRSKESELYQSDSAVDVSETPERGETKDPKPINLKHEATSPVNNQSHEIT